MRNLNTTDDRNPPGKADLLLVLAEVRAVQNQVEHKGLFEAHRITHQFGDAQRSRRLARGRHRGCPNGGNETGKRSKILLNFFGHTVSEMVLSFLQDATFLHVLGEMLSDAGTES